MAVWGFLTHHSHVVIQIARSPRSTIREIALATGITERATHAVLKDLRQAGIIVVQREGRQNVNQINPVALLNHRPWAATDMEVPQALIEAALRGLAAAAGGNPQAIAQPASAGDSGPPGLNGEESRRRWGFLTTHALVLIYVTQHPHSTIREIALGVGVTERAAHSVLRDLREAAIIECEREGRRNSYTVSFVQLSGFRREGTAPGLVPDTFVSSLIDALLPLQAPAFPSLEEEVHPLG